MIVEITTDGSSLKNPGPGGWACIFRVPGRAKALYGYDIQTTNNRMELTAVISALEHLSRPCEVKVYTDSQYVHGGITSWIEKWKKNGWQAAVYNPYRKKYAGTKDVVNQDLWRRLDAARSRHKVEFIWVRGHANNEDNIQCDLIAREAARRQLSGIREIKVQYTIPFIVTEKHQVVIPVEIDRAITFE